MDPVRQLLKWARGRAKRMGMEFDITVSDITIPLLCPILALELQPHKLHVGPASPTIDRKDNSLGYIPGNVWVVSSLANSMKNRATVDQLRLFSRWVQAEYGVSKDTRNGIDTGLVTG